MPTRLVQIALIDEQPRAAHPGLDVMFATAHPRIVRQRLGKLPALLGNLPKEEIGVALVGNRQCQKSVELCFGLRQIVLLQGQDTD